MKLIRTITSNIFSAALLAVLSLGNTRAQVTIGSSSQPALGALLDLKEENSFSGGATSTRGLGLPRVELQGLTKLQMGSTAPELSGTDLNKHIGLVVFNTSETDPFCKGLYVWNGATWQRLQAPCIGVTVDPASVLTDGLYFLSGQNGSNITSVPINISWEPAGASATWSSTGINFAPSVPAAPWGTSPQNGVMFAPEPMTDAEVVNPFAVKTGTLTITATNNGKTATQNIAVKQVNKAILVNGSLVPEQLRYNSNTTTPPSLTVQSNAQWKLASIKGSGLPAVSLVDNSNLGLVQGSEIDNEGITPPITSIGYNVTTGSNYSRYTYLSFEDANPSGQRFKDVLLTIVQCNGESDLTMAKYKELWEELYGLDPNDNEEHDTNGDITKNKNRVQWHYDQDNNIFFSSYFGDAGRWMTTNVAAITYDSNVTTADPVQSFAAGTVPRYGYPAAGGAYPGGGSTAYPDNNTKYAARERLGRLYNWAAATGEQNNNVGYYNQSGENPSPQVQGICPDGWHLPGDKDWNDLMTEFQAHPGLYSYNDINPTYTAYTAKDVCEVNAGTGMSFSVLNGGFGMLLVGFVQNNVAYNYDVWGMYWSSSYNGIANEAWDWYALNNNTQVLHDDSDAQAFLSVRCKKDTPD